MLHLLIANKVYIELGLRQRSRCNAQHFALNFSDVSCTPHRAAREPTHICPCSS